MTLRRFSSIPRPDEDVLLYLLVLLVCAILKNARVAVKMRRADLSVVTADELGPGETFGEACMLEENRALLALRRSSLNNDDSEGNSNSNSSSDTASREGAREQTKGEGDARTGSSAPPGATTAARRETEPHEPKLEAPEKMIAHPVGSGEAGLADAVDASEGGGPNLNPNAGRSTETYQTMEPTRLVLILKADFHRIPGLLKHCSHAFKVMEWERADVCVCV